MTDNDVIYGWYAHHETWAVIEAGRARSLADAVRRTQGAATVGEMRAVYAQVDEDLLPLPQDDWLAEIEDPDGEVDDEAAFDWQSLPGVEDGDWPPMPSRMTLSMPKAIVDDLLRLPSVAHSDTVFNGDYLVIPREAELDLLEVLGRHGIQPHRDDDTVFALAGGAALYG